MKSPLPLPSHIHYEALLQLLEKQTLSSATRYSPELRKQVQSLMFALRKAFSQQKQLEDYCEQLQIPYEDRWSLNTESSQSAQKTSFKPPKVS